MSEVVVTPQQGLAGKYQPYPEYKVSGVEWIGDVPQSWEATKVKRWLLESPCYGVLKPDKYDGDDAVPLIRIMDVKADGTVAELETLESISPSLSIEYQRTLIRKGDLIVSVVGTLGRSFICDDAHERMNLSRALTRLQVCDLSTAKYLQYVINSKVFEDYVGVTCTGAAQKVLNLEDVSNWFVPSPPLVHRSTIVAFLDYETARIDRLIAQQQRLIELLKEKRQAVISHAVTKGLNPNAPMKDSGVEWLGQVPEHWEVAKLRRFILEHRQGYYTTDPYVDEGIKLLRITDLRELGHIDVSSCPLVPNIPSVMNFKLKEGDVVFARTGGAGSFGIIDELECDIVYASYLIRFRFNSKHLTPSYLRFLLLSDSLQLSLKQNIHGGVNQNIHAEDIKDAIICVPPINEQLAIEKALTAKMKRYSELLEESEKSVRLMSERRTALISAAVTGKIDLRGWTPPVEEAAA